MILQYVSPADDTSPCYSVLLELFCPEHKPGANQRQIRLIKYANPLIGSCEGSRGTEAKKLIEMNWVSGWRDYERISRGWKCTGRFAGGLGVWLFLVIHIFGRVKYRLRHFWRAIETLFSISKINEIFLSCSQLKDFFRKILLNIYKDVRKFLISLEPDILKVGTFQTKKPLTHPNILTIL